MLVVADPNQIPKVEGRNSPGPPDEPVDDFSFSGLRHKRFAFLAVGRLFGIQEDRWRWG